MCRAALQIATLIDYIVKPKVTITTVTMAYGCLPSVKECDMLSVCGQNKKHQIYLGPIDQGFLTRGKFPPWGKYWEFRGEMRAFENCCLFKTGDTKWFL